MILILDCLHHQLPCIFPLYGEQFIKDCVCDICSKQRMSSNCALCKNKFHTVYFEVADTELRKLPIRWYHLEKNVIDQLENKTKKGTIEDILQVLKAMIKKLLFHFFIKREQSKAYQEMKSIATSENSAMAMVQMDYAENFKCVYQDEVASAHWKTSLVTLYTVMIWHKTHSISIVIVSDNKNHDKPTVVPYSYAVFKYFEELFGDTISKISVWTDGPSSQYKSKFIFGYIGLCLPNLFPGYQIKWNYSATSHGKGAVDGLGNTWRPILLLQEKRL